MSAEFKPSPEEEKRMLETGVFTQTFYITRAMYQAIMASRLRVDLVRWLGNHPEQCQRISNLSPASAAREISQIEKGMVDGR